MSKFNTGQSFADGDKVKGAKLNNITSTLNIYTGVISEQTAMSATVSTLDQLLIADTDNGDSGAANRVTVQKLLNDTLTNGTYTNAQLSGNLNVTQLSTLGTISSTTGTIQTLTSSTANISQGSAIFTQGTIATLNSTTGTIANLNSTTGTIATLNSTTGTIATLNSTTGTIPTLVATTLITTGTGTAAAPAISPTGDSNNGLFFPAADTIAVTTQGTERLRLNSSGNIGIGFTTGTIGGDAGPFMVSSPSAVPILANRPGDGDIARFYRANVQVGSINLNGSATAYVTSSDYRLKTNLEPISNGIERVKQLPVYRFNWIENQSGNKVDGFVAHEAQAIVPECVVGKKDAVDANGKPIHQGIDQSKIVPLLTAALKEAIAKIEVLESKVATLEAV